LDSDPAEAAQTRRQISEQVAVEKTMMISSHFSFPGMGHVAKHEQSYKWEPINWQW